MCLIYGPYIRLKEPLKPLGSNGLHGLKPGWSGMNLEAAASGSGWPLSVLTDATKPAAERDPSGGGRGEGRNPVSFSQNCG